MHDTDHLESFERLVFMAAISAGLAHDLSCPLGALTLQLQAFGKQLHLAEQEARAHRPTEPAFDACRSSLEALEETSEFLRRLIRDFVKFSGGSGVGEGTAPLRPAVEVAVRMTRTLVCDRATVEIAVPPDLSVAVGEVSVVRATMHLLVNAAEAFPTAAPLVNRIRVTAQRAAGRILLDVEDNGVGVPAEVVGRLFQPFATSKPSGLGLGLVVARSLLRRAGGDLELLASGPGGATFRCVLPEAQLTDR